MAYIYKNDIGTLIEATIIEKGAILNIGTATTKQFLFKKPSGAILTKVAAFSSDGTDGKLKYLTISGDLDETGTWVLQGRVVMPTGSWSTQETEFYVHGIIE